jgi:hypothetical protein
MQDNVRNGRQQMTTAMQCSTPTFQEQKKRKWTSSRHLRQCARHFTPRAEGLAVPYQQDWRDGECECDGCDEGRCLWVAHGEVLLRISQCQSGSQLSCSLVYSPSGGQRGGKRQRRCCAQSSERLGLRTSMSHKRPRGSYYAGQLVRGAGMVEWSDGIPGSRTRRQSTCSTRPSWIYTAAPQGPAMGRPVDLSRQTRTLPGGT